jgi:hypothetical protein
VTEFSFEPDTGNFTDIPPSEIDRETLIRISKTTGTPIPELLALSAQLDPLYRGSEADWARATKFMDAIARANISHQIHQRGCWYLGVTVGEWGQDPDRTEQEYEEMRAEMNLARVLGLVEPWAFPDHKTRQLAPDGRVGSTELSYTKPSLDLPTFSTREDGRVGGFYAATHQPLRILVVCENDEPELMPEIRPVCRAYGAELCVTSGNASRGLPGRALKEAIEDTAKRAEEDEDERPLVVLWLSDADRTTIPPAAALSSNRSDNRYFWVTVIQPLFSNVPSLPTT